MRTQIPLTLLLLAGSTFGNELEIINVRVGQGDATLIQGPVDDNGNRVNVLFDAGDVPARDGGNILRAVLNKRGVDRLDHLIISHDDADHIGGVAFGNSHGASFILGFDDAPGSPGDDDSDGEADWLGTPEFFNPDPDELGTGDDLPVDNFIDYGDALMRDTQAIRKYQGIANAMGTRTVLNSQDDVDSFEIDLGGGARMICFAANGFVRGRGARVSNVNRPNERSLSFLVNYGQFDFLISGDLSGRASGADNAEVERAVGQAIVNAGFSVDILHVNHHGADNASEADFLELIEPEIAIISAGNGNTHEHPRNAVLQRLVDAGVYRIIQTSWGTTEDVIADDIRDHQAIYQSDVVITSDGERYTISTARTFETDEDAP